MDQAERLRHMMKQQEEVPVQPEAVISREEQKRREDAILAETLQQKTMENVTEDSAERQEQAAESPIDKQEKKKSHAARVITVTSGKGGVGKTSVSVNLALQFRRFGYRVIVLDADFGLANIEIMLGTRPQYNLADLIFHGKEMQDIIAYGPEGIGFISGGSGISEMADLTRDQIVLLVSKLEELDEMADVIIVDTGAGMGNSVLEFVAASSEVLLVATSEPTSITDAYSLLKSLNSSPSYRPGMTSVKTIANQVPDVEDANAIFAKIGDVVKRFLKMEVEYLGAIPFDTQARKAVMQQKPVSVVNPAAPSSKAILHIAQKLENRETPVEKRGIMQLFSNVIKMRFRR